MLSSILLAAFFAVISAHNSLRQSGVFPNPSWMKPISYFLTDGTPIEFSYGYVNSTDSIAINWVTTSYTEYSMVQYGLTANTYTNTVNGTFSNYTIASNGFKSSFFHTAILTKLKLNTTYHYRVGGPDGWSNDMVFTSHIGIGPDISFSFAVMADVGESTAANATVAHVSTSKANFILHPGDISYCSGCESLSPITVANQVWDLWGILASSIALAGKAYMVGIGNHERYDYNAQPYAYRYRSMPYNGYDFNPPDYSNAFFYSYDYGMAHFLIVDGFYPLNFTVDSPLTKFIIKDLLAYNRSVTPFFVLAFHPPVYNSNTEHQGDAAPFWNAYINLFYAVGVNFVLAGHVHSFEASDYIDINGNVNPSDGIRFFNLGDGGANLYTTWLPQPAWSVYRVADWGHGEFTFVNSSLVEFNWISDETSENAYNYTTTINNLYLGQDRSALVQAVIDRDFS